MHIHAAGELLHAMISRAQVRAAPIQAGSPTQSSRASRTRWGRKRSLSQVPLRQSPRCQPNYTTQQPERFVLDGSLSYASSNHFSHLCLQCPAANSACWPSTAALDTVNNLGNLYAVQGRLAEAQKMYERALQGYEIALGPKHTSTLDIINNLGVLYTDQGKPAEAHKMYERALQGREEALGPEHTSTLQTVNKLGALYADQGKLAEAQKMYERALRGYEEALGHKDVQRYMPALITMKNLGDLCREHNKHAEAQEMYLRAMLGLQISRSQNL
jgi:tetratricopeptide (TPR) repeat protein